MNPANSDRLLGVMSLVLLGAGCALVLWPFLSSLAWAAILVSSSWGAYVRLAQLLGQRRTLAASLMTLLVTLVLLVPVSAVTLALSDDVASLGRSAAELLREGLPAAPEWIKSLPLIGSVLDSYWQQFAHNGQRLVEELSKLAHPAQTLALASGRVVARGLVDMSLSVFLGFFLFLHGQSLATRLIVALQRVSGPRASHLLELTRGTVTGVVYGILGTALAQAVLAAIGLTIAGVPGPVLLGVATFFLSVVPVGPPLVWGGATIWLFAHDQPLWAAFMAAWGFFGISMVDNIIKPFIISRGSQLPFAIVFLGVLGGVLAFGVIGAFLGPALLAVGFRLLTEWTNGQNAV
ncbi:AI-2E family transporter [Rhodoferax sp.]|uniref:AI-2E family transporter n=1 Tax=Rhodoferax sp. TaxID=50421 RepID=UPI00262CA9D0|nr:AI-2E family transporter [Rhodoferax sp.]MDD2927066.1 AI-2E family transporter [Rhodoferax sp.]